MRSKKQLIITTFLGIFGLLAAGPARAQEIQWRTDYATAAREAAEKNRPMFLDVFKLQCLYCTKLDTITYRDPGFIKLVNEKFIPVKVDGEINMVDVQGQRVQAFPTLFFLAVDGNVLEKQEGFTDAAHLLKLGQQALGTPSVPKKDVVSFQAQAKVGSIGNLRANVWKGPRQIWFSPTFSADPVNSREERMMRAREILVQAVDNFRKQQWLSCLEQSRVLIVYYPDLPESADARQLASAINPETLEKLGKDLTENLSQVYWELAQQKLRQGQTSQAIIYLERILQSCPGSRYAAPAQELLQRHTEGPPPPAPTPTKVSVRVTTRRPV